VIALLMFERGLSFDEAWQACERQRPIIYPNVGFQQQLRYFEVLLRRMCGSELRPAERLQQLREMVPRGDLADPSSSMKIEPAISDAVHKAIDALDKLVAKSIAQPDTVHQSRIWQRHGRFWESMSAYAVLPHDPSLIDRAKLVNKQLQLLCNSGDSSKAGFVRLAALGSEIAAWIQKVRVTQPLAHKQDEPGTSSESAEPRALLGAEYDSSDGEESSRDRSRSRQRCVPRNRVAMVAADEAA